MVTDTYTDIDTYTYTDTDTDTGINIDINTDIGTDTGTDIGLRSAQPRQGVAVVSCWVVSAPLKTVCSRYTGSG